MAGLSPDLGKRIASGVVLAPLAGAAIIYGNWPFMIMVFAGLVLALYEWAKLVEHLPHKYIAMAAGAFYAALCFGAYVFLRFGFDQGAWLALGIIICVWASDIGAYFVGKAIGGPKLAPKISPKKTWAGFAGAVFSSGIAMMILVGIGPYLLAYMDTDLGLRAWHVWRVFFVGCAVGAVGQAGDLLVSFMKRKAGAKDAGSIIPGHGGILDRIDSLMLVCVFFLLVVMAWL